MDQQVCRMCNTRQPSLICPADLRAKVIKLTRIDFQTDNIPVCNTCYQELLRVCDFTENMLKNFVSHFPQWKWNTSSDSATQTSATDYAKKEHGPEEANKNVPKKSTDSKGKKQVVAGPSRPNTDSHASGSKVRKVEAAAGVAANRKNLNAIRFYNDGKYTPLTGHEYKCNMCGHVAGSMLALDNHMLRKICINDRRRKNMRYVQIEDGRFKCLICENKILNTDSGMILHMRHTHARN